MQIKGNNLIAPILLVLVLGIVIFFTYRTSQTVAPSADQNGILFIKTESWGPCPDNAICYQEISLEHSGMLKIKGLREIEKNIDTETVQSIRNEITTNNLMTKDCSAPLLLDYYATYKLYINDQEKIIRYPGCEKELKVIDDILEKQYE